MEVFTSNENKESGYIQLYEYKYFIENIENIKNNKNNNNNNNNNNTDKEENMILETQQVSERKHVIEYE